MLVYWNKRTFWLVMYLELWLLHSINWESISQVIIIALYLRKGAITNFNLMAWVNDVNDGRNKKKTNEIMVSLYTMLVLCFISYWTGMIYFRIDSWSVVSSRTAEILSTSTMESGSMTSGMMSMSVSFAISFSTGLGGSPVTDTVTSECQAFRGRFEASSWPLKKE